MTDVNLGVAWWLSKAVAPHMEQAGSGVIVHVAARPGVEPTAGVAAYGVSKAALIHLTRTLDVGLRPHGIRVNAVVPQIIATAKNKALFRPEMLAGAVEPESIAAVITFLLSEDAAADQRSDRARLRRLTDRLRTSRRHDRPSRVTEAAGASAGQVGG